MPKKKIYKLPFKSKKTYEWLVIAQSYLQCALMTARIVRLKISEFGLDKKNPISEQIYGDYGQSVEYLVYPVLFNFKHGVELYLKVLSGLHVNEFNKEHNLESLLSEVDSLSINPETKAVIKKYSRSKLLLPNNQDVDEMNEFERYPQDSPYDNGEFFELVKVPILDELIGDIGLITESLRSATIDVN